MEPEMFSSLFQTLGVSAIFVAAAWYLMRRMEEREQTRVEEAQEREQRLLDALQATESYCRETMAATLKQNTEAMVGSAEAMHHVARALLDVPCRRADLDNLEKHMQTEASEARKSR